MKTLRRIRFFISWLVFEYWLKKEPANKVAKKIIAEVDDYNRRYSQSKCHHCGADDFISKIYCYECTKCGNQQKTTGRLYKYVSREIDEKGIKKDGGDYRYYIWTLGLVMVVFFVLPISLFILGMIYLFFLN